MASFIGRRDLLGIGLEGLLVTMGRVAPAGKCSFNKAMFASCDCSLSGLSGSSAKRCSCNGVTFDLWIPNKLLAVEVTTSPKSAGWMDGSWIGEAAWFGALRLAWRGLRPLGDTMMARSEFIAVAAAAFFLIVGD